MAYTIRLFTSIANVDLAAWERVRLRAGASVFMDPRFIATVEISMKEDCRFWHVIVDDADRNPVACACLTATTMDLADFADPHLAALIRYLPAVMSRFRRLRVFSCGMPGSPAEKALTMTAWDDSTEILAVIDKVICELAVQARSDGIFYREFAEHDLKSMNALLDLGYTRVAIPPTHFFRPSFRDLQHYSSALKSHYRKQIRRSLHKLERMGVAVTVLTDPGEITNLYTSDVHRLYCQVVDRAGLKPEVLPFCFFQEMANRLEGNVELIVLGMGTRIVALAWCLQDGSTYHMLFGGVDYSLNAELDLYFNMVYAALDRAFRIGASTIHVGQTANAFKARLGCDTEPRYAFAKGVGPLMSRIVRYGSDLLVAKLPTVPKFDVFRSEPRHGGSESNFSPSEQT